MTETPPTPEVGDGEAIAAPRCYKCDKAIIGGETIVGINVSAQAGRVIMSPHCWPCAIAALSASAAPVESTAVAYQECLQAVEDEEVPAAGEMPPTIIERVLAGDTVYVERAIIAAVTATKRGIAARIAALAAQGRKP